MWDRKRDTDIISLIHSSKALKIVNNLILVDLGDNLRERRKRNLTEHLPCSKAVLDALSVEAHVIFMMNIRLIPNLQKKTPHGSTQVYETLWYPFTSQCYFLSLSIEKIWPHVWLHEEPLWQSAQDQLHTACVLCGWGRNQLLGFQDCTVVPFRWPSDGPKSHLLAFLAFTFSWEY